MSNPTLVWKSSKFPRTFFDAEGNRRPLSKMVYTNPSIDCIARVVCRKEIEEAKSRVIVERGKYFFQPSIGYIRARLGFRPKNSVKWERRSI
jgi:hypothetical protein